MDVDVDGWVCMSGRVVSEPSVKRDSRRGWRGVERVGGGEDIASF